MYIKQVKINNFRKIESLEFSLKKSINTIVGPNGVGKSTVLNAIRLVIVIVSYCGCKNRLLLVINLIYQKYF